MLRTQLSLFDFVFIDDSGTFLPWACPLGIIFLRRDAPPSTALWRFAGSWGVPSDPMSQFCTKLA